MSADALREEHESIQRAVRDARRHALTPSETQFVREMRNVMDDYLKAREAGVTRDQATAGVEAVLRSVWTHRPSKFGPACDSCDDTGWTEHVCWLEQRCDRETCAKGHPGNEHTYVRICGCPKGDRFSGRGRAQQLDDISQSMRVKKPKGFTRFGR